MATKSKNEITMNYTTEMRKAVAEQIAAMLDNDVINENGFEPFEVWCNDGEVFANMDEESGADFVNGCMNLVHELAPMVNAIHANLAEDEL